jgi:hypothetical protein
MNGDWMRKLGAARAWTLAVVAIVLAVVWFIKR